MTDRVFESPSMATQQVVFEHVTGIVMDSSKRYQGYGAGIPATLHHEIWLQDDKRREHCLHLVDDEFPVRKSQRLEAIYADKQLVGLINYTTNKYINLVPYAYQPIENVVRAWFPDLLNWRHMAVIVVAMFAIALVLERQPLWAFLSILWITAVVLLRNRRLSSGAHVPVLLHGLLEKEIKAAFARKAG